ncbi:helix-turn-helix transcriptional regulator [Streptomyces sp. C11-1]|uniref:Helix-turn-helix transcriptional regulator n=1 Tax=Streptomyces durocortorensis TaxID=2811104 RepID=A0ABY9W3F5_9ACTN|nr:helix-turn-helix transcriptional regulator [Streptomyces durocortorensis]WNF27826.1 helix-turn-helix transcriptional regulator [Streptomyces durocortorensis]
MTQRRSNHGYEQDDEDDFLEWEDHVMATVAGEVRRRRKELRWSAQDLADRCEEIGYPIPRNVIANMESGRRATLPLVEIMVLAKALRVSPISLIYPVGYVADVRQLPFENPRPAWDALQWFVGGSTVEDATNSMLDHFLAHDLELRSALAAVESEDYERWKVKTAPNRVQREAAERALARYTAQATQARHELLRHRDAIREAGGIPPHLPLSLADIDPPESDTDSTEENDL